MVPRLVSLAAIVASILFAASAFAIPAPMSPEELVARSDVVALVRVLSVTCTGEWTDERTGDTLHSYAAELEVIEATKGAEAADVLTIGFEDIPRGLLGPWSVFYYPGQEVWTHLVRSADGAYSTTWWNAVREEVRPPDTTELPEGPC
jgi:hypothetical protein